MLYVPSCLYYLALPLPLWRAHCALTQFPDWWFIVCQSHIWSVHSRGETVKWQTCSCRRADKGKAKKSALEAKESESTLTRIFFPPCSSDIWQGSFIYTRYCSDGYRYQRFLAFACIYINASHWRMSVFSLWIHRWTGHLLLMKKSFNIKSRVTVAKREYPQKINLAPT